MDSTGSGQGGDASTSFIQITDGLTRTKIVDLNKCDMKTQNLYVTVTRTKKTPVPTLNEGDEFLARQLQALTPDFEIGFTLIAGNAKFLGALSFTIVALLSVFAF